MHLIVPFAGSLCEAGQLAQQTLLLPGLERLLARLSPGPLLGSDEHSLNPPHEQALARAWGWAGDGIDLSTAALPFAARRATDLGLQSPAEAQAAWGLLTPVHLHAGSEQISLTDPASLQLDPAASRELLQIVRHCSSPKASPCIGPRRCSGWPHTRSSRPWPRRRWTG